MNNKNSANANFIKKYKPPIYEGHNNEMSYRYLGIFPVVVIGYEIMKSQTVLLVRYQYPGSGLFRSVPYKPLNPNTIKFFLYTVPFYLAFDIIYRNYKYMQNRTAMQKIVYSTDLLLFHLLATCYIPYKVSAFTAQRIPYLFSYFVRLNYPLLFLSTMGYVFCGIFQVKMIDILADVLLDNTLRKFYNFKIYDRNDQVLI